MITNRSMRRLSVMGMCVLIAPLLVGCPPRTEHTRIWTYEFTNEDDGGGGRQSAAGARAAAVPSGGNGGAVDWNEVAALVRLERQLGDARRNIDQAKGAAQAANRERAAADYHAGEAGKRRGEYDAAVERLRAIFPDAEALVPGDAGPTVDPLETLRCECEQNLAGLLAEGHPCRVIMEEGDEESVCSFLQGCLRDELDATQYEELWGKACPDHPVIP